MQPRSFRAVRPVTRASVHFRSLRARHIAFVATSGSPNAPAAVRPSSPSVSPRYDQRHTIPPKQEPSPTSRYHELVERSILRDDAHQRTIIKILQDLHDKLDGYKRPPLSAVASQPNSSVFGRFFGGSKGEPLDINLDAPKGLYLYGDVGTGKSMLMDLFYDTLPSSIKKKRRVHFHAFMIEIHKALHKQAERGVPVEDAISPVATELAKEVEVLCFDEFQVTDIVDAMILRRLLERLIDCGVVMVMTSNRHPDDLYKNGIQRDSFIPAIELLKNRLKVTDLNSGTDYRKLPRTLSKVYYHPINHENEREFDKLFDAVTGGDIELDRRLTVWGRDLVIPSSGNGAARFTFNELCGNPLSAADYIEITRTFGTIFIDDIPLMNLNSKDKARRFITFIDACYESKTKLFTLSEVPVFEVFSNEKSNGNISDHMRSVMDDLGLSKEIVGASSIFTGEEEIFAFARACSRLVEMGSKQWAETVAS
ncbi:AFG1-like ATPase [Clavulina sp. PMI_390]|nr:AFG1-like ATPase [Clavulina sp. PMI_390]